MDAVMKANPTLAGTLPRIYNRDNIDQRRLGELVDLFNNARFSRQGEHRARDLMGEVYEYFLGAFARAEGKRGGEFFTPPSVVKVIVEVLEPSHGRVYDPCCGSGGMFVQTEKFIHEHEGDTKDISVFGQASSIGRATSRIRAGGTASRRPTTPTTPGSSTSCPSSPPAGRLAS
jgi:type I restriction enzyme M protein